MPGGFIVLKSGVTGHAPDIEQDCVQLIREQIGAGGRLQNGPDRAAAAQDALRQDPARDHAQIADGRTGKCRRPSMIPPFSMRSRPSSERRAFDPKAAQNEWT